MGDGEEVLGGKFESLGEEMEYVPDEDEEENIFIRKDDFHGVGGGDVEGEMEEETFDEQAALEDDLTGDIEIGGAEEYPAETDEMKGEEEGEEADYSVWRDADEGVEGFFDGEGCAVQGSPDEEFEGLSVNDVPETAEGHGYHEVNVSAEFTFAVSAEGDV